MPRSSWQTAEVARNFLTERRGAIPFGSDQLLVMLKVIRHFNPEPRLIMELGCGDGIAARGLLDEFPNARALLLDNSPAMLHEARLAMAPYGGRCEIQCKDLSEPLLQAPGTVDVVVSAYAIHHLPHDRKRSLYAEIYSLLAEGGVFVNVEHVASCDTDVERLFDGEYIGHIARRSGKPIEVVEHEYHSRPDKADNILAPVGMQLGWLREAGFQHVDCHFKWFELAVFGGVKE